MGRDWETRCPVHPLEPLPCPLCNGASRVRVLEPTILDREADHIRPSSVAPQTFTPTVRMGMARTADQLGQALWEADQHGELIKLEAVPAFGPDGVRSYRFTIWSLPWP